MTNLPHLTRCGLPGIDHIPVGMHACHFYNDRDELVSALVPYCIAGLRSNERCLLVTAPPLPACELLQELRAAWVGIDDALQMGALRIVDFDQWYASSGQLKGLDVVELWLKEEERALAEGYSGLRIAGNVSFLEPSDWPGFLEYEEAVSARFHGRHIVALCSYAVAECSDQQMSQVRRAHHCAFERADKGRSPKLKVVQASGAGRIDGENFPRHEERRSVTSQGGNNMTFEITKSSAADAGAAASKSYRCYFTSLDDRFQSYEAIECVDDAQAALKAQELLAASPFTAAEVWEGGRLVGKWANGGAARFEGDADTKA